jgi:hypothetical protein
MRITFITCRELKVYNDMGYDEKRGGFVDTGISTCECKAYQQGRKCKNKGRCIIARENETWLQVSSKSFGDKVV